MSHVRSLIDLLTQFKQDYKDGDQGCCNNQSPPPTFHITPVQNRQKNIRSPTFFPTETVPEMTVLGRETIH